jgi:hypothetical protein
MMVDDRAPASRGAAVRRWLCAALTTLAFGAAPLGASAAGRPAPNRLALNVARAKAAGHEFRRFTLFHESGHSLNERPALAAMVSEGTLLRLDDAAAQSLLVQNPRYVTLPVPGHGALELVQVDYSDLIVEGSNGEDLSRMHTAKHYQGTLDDDDRSLAALSVFRNLETGNYEVAGLYSTRSRGNVIIGRLKGDNRAGEHLVYRDDAVVDRPPTVECGLEGPQDRDVLGLDAVLGLDQPVAPRLPLRRRAAPLTPGATLARCLRLHLEVEYDVYQAQGANTANYATGFFNIGQAVYTNENIPLSLYYLKVWTTPNPEQSVSGYQTIWNRFWNRMFNEGIQGDLAMLIGFHIDRGIAALNPVCGPDYNQAGISPIRDYPSYPTYSWASATFPHEIGHLFGSNHTQACVWNGNNTALDGCAAPEGSCARPASQFGTIMSYCSNFSLAQGFGTQPGNLIRANFGNASCVIDCGGTSCTYTISPTSASVAASGGGGSVSVTTSASNCTWTSSSNASWLTITAGGGTRTGNGSLSYSAAANTGAASRSGTLTVAGRTFTVSQAGGSTGLGNGVPVSVSGAQGSQTLYYVDVPSGASNLVIETSGGTGDLDLYTRFGSAPTLSTYDCRPYASSNNESCPVAAPAAGRYYVLLHGYAAYSGASLKASFSTTSGTPPTITTQPQSRSVSAGQTATFSVAASGTAPLSYQWLRNGTALAGATSAAYTTPATTAADNGATFSVRVSNAYGSVTSSNATLTVTSGTATTVRVLAPNGGEVWTRGSTRAITWTTTNSQHVDVALYKGGAFVQWLTWFVVSSTGSYNWTIPTSLAAGSDYRVTVVDYDQRTISDSSDGTFTIN